ncbi:MAG: hypothetical protein ACRDL2_02265 [Gaiellaceae bacterium]
MEPRLLFFRAPKRRRLAVGLAVLFVSGDAIAAGFVPSVAAIFTAETAHSNAVAPGGWIPGPSGTSDTVVGAENDQRRLSWTSGASAGSPSPNPVTGQTIFAADGGSAAGASCGTYNTLARVSATTATYADSSLPVADWWCYEVMSTSSGSWTSGVATFTPVRLLVPVSVVIANGGTGTNRVNSGDTVKITFNQDIRTPAADRLCKIGSGRNDVILLGDTRGSGTCSIGELTGGSISATTRLTETASVSGNVLTVRVSQNGTATATGTWTFTAASSVASSDGSTSACTASACRVTATGHF